MSKFGPYSEKLWTRTWKCCPRPAASGSIFKTSLGYSFSLYEPPSRQLTYISLASCSILAGESMNWGFPTFLGRALTVFVSTDVSLNTLFQVEDAAISLFLPPVIRVFASELGSKIGIYFNWQTKSITRLNVLLFTDRSLVSSIALATRSWSL